MKLNLVIELGNDAMQFLDRDVAPALRKIADEMEASRHSGRRPVPISDINGNIVGVWQLAEEEEAAHTTLAGTSRLP